MKELNIETWNVSEIQANYIDCCTPDYFNGCRCYELLSIPVYANITYQETYDDLLDEFNSTSGYFDSVAGSAGMLEDALKEMFSDIKNMSDIADFSKGIEDNENDNNGATVYLYIALNAI